MKVFGILLLLLQLLAVIQAIPTIYVDNPISNAVFTLGINQEEYRIPASYQLFDTSTNEQYPVCLELFREGYEEPIVKPTCYTEPSQSLTLNLPSSTYRLHFYLTSPDSKAPIESSRIIKHFKVRTIDDIYPKIQVLNDNAVFVSSWEKKVATDASIQFSLTESTVPLSSLKICVTLAQGQDVLMSLTCLQSIMDRSLFLSSLAEGRYSLTLVLLDIKTETVLPKTAVTSTFEVKNLVAVLPRIEAVTGLTVDVAVDPTQGFGELTLEHKVSGLPTAVSQVQVCLSISKDSAQEEEEEAGAVGALLLPLTCVKQTDTVLSLSRLPAGNYRATYMLQTVHGSIAFPQSEVVVAVHAQGPEEFQPSYDWQPLKPWHTIPAGIETR